MRVTIDGQRLAPSVGYGAIHSGAKPTVKVAASPRVVWNGNPYTPPGTVLYLPGYPGTGAKIYDFSGQGNDGAITGATWTRTGQGLWYLDFDATDDYISLGKPSFSSDQQGTIEFWTTLTSSGATNVPFAYGKKSTGAVDEWEIRANGTTLTLSIFVFDNTVVSLNTATGAGKFTLGAPFHLRVTSDNSTLKMYVNGQLETLTDAEGTNSGQWFGDLTTDADSFVFGGLERDSALIVGWTGMIALPRIYSAEVGGHYNQERHLFGV